MRRAIIQVSPELLVQIMKDGTGMVEVVANPLPADARIVDARLSFGGVTLELVVESETYPEVQRGSHLTPLPAPTFRRKAERPNAEFFADLHLLKGAMTPNEVARREND